MSENSISDSAYEFREMLIERIESIAGKLPTLRMHEASLQDLVKLTVVVDQSFGRLSFCLDL